MGGVTPIRLKARVITATNQDLEELIRQNRFREDLYYRLCVVPIHVPPLKHRPGDTLLLADYFLQKFNSQYGLRKKLDDGKSPALSAQTLRGRGYRLAWEEKEQCSEE